MAEEVYRYTTLTGAATITIEGNFISVLLLDPAVNPERKPLFFSPPINSDNIEILAGLNQEWFDHHTNKDKIKFRTENGAFATKWTDLELPENKAEMDKMNPVKPIIPVPTQ